MMNNGTVYTMTSYLGLSEARQSLFWTIHTALSLIAIPIVYGIANKWDKKKAMVVFIGSYVVGSVIWFALGMVTTVGFVSYNIFAGILCLGTAAFYGLLVSLLYDCTDVYTLVTGEQKEGSMLAMQGLAQTLGAAFASLFLGWGLQIIGYTEAAAVTDFVAKGIWSLGTIVPAVLVVISMIFLIRYNLTRDDFEAVKQAIEDRKEGKEIDMSRFEHLI
jgi:Na+/melibiose symporter-like transporter